MSPGPLTASPGIPQTSGGENMDLNMSSDSRLIASLFFYREVTGEAVLLTKHQDDSELIPKSLGCGPGAPSLQGVSKPLGVKLLWSCLGPHQGCHASLPAPAPMASQCVLVSVLSWRTHGKGTPSAFPSGEGVATQTADSRECDIWIFCSHCPQ